MGGNLVHAFTTHCMLTHTSLDPQGYDKLLSTMGSNVVEFLQVSTFAWARK